jgi:hypothetical protein
MPKVNPTQRATRFLDPRRLRARVVRAVIREVVILAPPRSQHLSNLRVKLQACMDSVAVQLGQGQQLVRRVLVRLVMSITRNVCRS